jgi:hypothetical protein
MTDTRYPTPPTPLSTSRLTDRICILTDNLSTLTGITWTLGYIGNCSGIPGTPAATDTRLWSVTAAHPGRVGTHMDSLGGHTTEDLADLLNELRGAVGLARVLNDRHAIVATPYGSKGS